MAEDKTRPKKIKRTEKKQGQETGHPGFNLEVTDSRWFYPGQYYRSLKCLLFKPSKAFQKSKSNVFLNRAILFLIPILLLAVILAHICSTYVFKDIYLLFWDISDGIKNVYPVFPLFNSYWIFSALITIPFIIILKGLIIHLAVLPQVKKKSLRTTFKLTILAETPVLYFAFAALYLMILKIPSSGDYPIENDALMSWAGKILFLCLLLYVVNNLTILIKGCRRYYKLEEHEAIFVAFFPYLFPVFVFGIYKLIILALGFGKNLLS